MIFLHHFLDENNWTRLHCGRHLIIILPDMKYVRSILESHQSVSASVEKTCLHYLLTIVGQILMKPCKYQVKLPIPLSGHEHLDIILVMTFVIFVECRDCGKAVSVDNNHH